MKLIVSDYDRTLKVDNVISLKDREAIANFIINGNQFAINSGRSIQFLKQSLKELQFTCRYLIAGSGSQIYQNNQLIIQHIIQQEYIDEVFPYLLQCNATLVQVFNTEKWTSHRFENGKLSHFCELEIPKGSVNGMGVRFNDVNQAQVVADYINNHYQLSAYANMYSVDIVAKGVSKSTGIYDLLSILSVDEVITVGDSLNDLSMIADFDGYVIKNSQLDKMTKPVKTCDNINDLIYKINQGE